MALMSAGVAVLPTPLPLTLVMGMVAPTWTWTSLLLLLHGVPGLLLAMVMLTRGATGATRCVLAGGGCGVAFLFRTRVTAGGTVSLGLEVIIQALCHGCLVAILHYVILMQVSLQCSN